MWSAGPFMPCGPRLETRGTLHFDAPDHLEKTTDPAADGSVERLTINGNQLTIDRGKGQAPVVLMLNEHPEIGVLVESIRATLSGDGAALTADLRHHALGHSQSLAACPAAT